MTGPSDVRIVIADDHPMFREGLRDAIRHDTAYAVIGEAANGEEAYEMLLRLRPEIAILDVEMPKASGLDVARRVYEESLPVSVIILTMYEEYAFFNTAIDAGVKGYILKESAVSDILQGISKVAVGEYYFSPSLGGHFMKRDADGLAQTDAGRRLESLTRVEREILELIAHSLTSRQISEKLSVSVRTVEGHRYNICQKLGLNGSYALLRYALMQSRFP